MITINTNGAYYEYGQWIPEKDGRERGFDEREGARRNTIAYRIMEAHAAKGHEDGMFRITFDALASHDITYVGIIQTARAGGMKEFPMPYVLTNCHNSLCAVGGTINEDDHVFGLSAAQKYGGDFVPPHVAVIHQYVRETIAGCGKMVLGSDSHTRYGALGTLGFGEGGPELVKQLLGRTYDLPKPEVVAVYLEGTPKAGVGPQDVALSLIKAVFAKGLVKNKVLEFFGPGLDNLSVGYRLGIDVMTTETTCLSSIWRTGNRVREWLVAHGRRHDFQEQLPEDGAWYDTVIHINLSEIEPMIALPFHPSNAWSIREFLENASDILAGVEEEAGRLMGKGATKPSLRGKLKGKDFFVDQAIVAGCSGSTFENMARVAQIVRGTSMGSGAFSFSVYPASLPQYHELVRCGLAGEMLEAGITLKTAFCGPCFGAGDVPANNAFSIRHTTRNFPNREGAKPSDGQMAYVALMDARSIAATAANQGKLTPATELPSVPAETPVPYVFNPAIYEKRVYRGFGKADPSRELIFGPNITDWPAMIPLPENLILSAAAVIRDPVTTTDELIPSGETSSYRSNPLRLAEFTLSRKEPEYVNRAKTVLALEEKRRTLTGTAPAAGQVPAVSAAAPYSAEEADVHALFAELGLTGQESATGIGSFVFAIKPGDGSAREQAASCQKVLGGWANLASEYATKRYRANLVNWGMLPFVVENAQDLVLEAGDKLVIPGIRQVLLSGLSSAPATLFRSGGEKTPLTLLLPEMTKGERDIILAGCLINYYSQS